MGFKRGRKYAGYVARARFQSSTVKRRKTAPKRKRVARSKRSLNTHSFSRYGLAETITLSNLEDSVAFSFAINQVIASSEFSSLFDRYRIDKVVVKLQLITNPDANVRINDGANSSVSNWYPKVWSKIDYDDTNAETIATMKERVGVRCRILQPNKTLVYTLKPAIAQMMYKTATTTGYGPKWNQFIDFTDISVPHYGIKFAFDSQGFDPSYQFSINKEVQYFFTCKDVR